MKDRLTKSEREVVRTHFKDTYLEGASVNSRDQVSNLGYIQSPFNTWVPDTREHSSSCPQGSLASVVTNG